MLRLAIGANLSQNDIPAGRLPRDKVKRLKLADSRISEA
jgi:hypothetical protein